MTVLFRAAAQPLSHDPAWFQKLHALGTKPRLQELLPILIFQLAGTMGTSYSKVGDPDRSLPVEIIIKILLYLSVKDFTSCRLVNNTLRDIIDGSPDIQHQVDTALAGVVDNPYITMSLLERKRALRLQQDAWNDWKPWIGDTFHTSCIPDLIQDGVYFKLHHPDTRNCVGYCFPPQPGQSSTLSWSYLRPLPRRFHIDIIALAVCLQENDLVAVGVQ